MTTPYSDLLAKLELAAQSLVRAGGTGIDDANVFTGQESQDKDAPLVICEADGGNEEDPPDSGCFWCELTVTVKTPAPIDVDQVDPKPGNDLIVAKVFDLFLSQTLPADLNLQAIPDFTVQGARSRRLEASPEGDEQSNSLKVSLLCCASTLAP